MKNVNFVMLTGILIASLTFLALKPQERQEEFMQMTTIESVVPAGLGRSRMIISDGKSTFEEVKMKNFFSAVGINFGNVYANDEQIAAKLTELESQGWNLENVSTGVYGADKSTGIFVTRYLFKK
mgnify:CR=1 FL=1